jgi:hypothetical protein
MERESSGEGPEPDFPPPRHPDPEQLPQLWNGEACQEHIIDTHTHMCTQTCTHVTGRCARGFTWPVGADISYFLKERSIQLALTL